MDLAESHAARWNVDIRCLLECAGVIRSAPECAGDFQAWGPGRGSARKSWPRKGEAIASRCAGMRGNRPEYARDGHDLGTPKSAASERRTRSLLGSSYSLAPSAATTSVRRLSDRTFSPRVRGVKGSPHGP